MRVAIVEIMDTGHIPMVDALCRIFCSEPGNAIDLFTLRRHEVHLVHLKEKLPGISFRIKDDNKSINDFLGEIALLSFDRVYVVTMTKYFPSFARWKLKSSLFLVIHNLDEWFSLSFVNNVGKFISGLFRKPDIKLLIYLVKLHFFIPRHKRRILDIVTKTKGTVVVLSESVRREAAKYNLTFNIEVVPFSVFERDAVILESDITKPLRICVPGIVSQYRRNYLALLDLTEKHLEDYKDDFILDFLGGVQPGNRLNDSAPVLEKAEVLMKKGFKIIIHDTGFIPVEEYNRELALSDIILGNMNVVLNSHSQYGKTKETGLPFAMIRAAKPGILPVDYPVPEEIITSTIRYENYDHLGEILTELINNRQQVTDLQKMALENSVNFSPDRIYKKITGGN
jgi:hypothetical protein